MLELYRAHTDYRGIMEDLEQTVAHAARAVTGGTRVEAGGRAIDLTPPFERLTVEEAFRKRLGIELAACDGDAGRLRTALRAAGLDAGRDGDSFDDLFFRAFLDRIEPDLGFDRPVYLIDWPAPMAALSRLKPDDPRFAERFELFAGGLELANGFSELTDAVEQRRRLLEEQAFRARIGRSVYPLDEQFLAALPRMPEAGGVALGLDRLLMLLIGAQSLDDVLLFPARGFLG
jgi:lysyl-tRNA synthetase class 2